MNLKDEYIHGGNNGVGLIRQTKVRTGSLYKQDGTTAGVGYNKTVLWVERAEPNPNYNSSSTANETTNDPWIWEEILIDTITTNTTGSAAKLSATDKGSATNPIYFSGGVPAACTYSLNATVPAGTANEILYYSAANTLATQNYTLLTANLNVFGYGTAASNCLKGLVPAPTANKPNYVLTANGWASSLALNTSGTAAGLSTTHYAAAITVQTAKDFDVAAEFGSVKINGRSASTASAATSNYCQEVYDTTNKCLKFVFA